MDYTKYENLRERLLGRGVVIAIDGPSGSGKSTISRSVSAALDLEYLDTGAMYRAAAWWVDHLRIDVQDQEAVTAAVGQMRLQINPVAHAPRLLVNDIDVKRAIRSDHINTIVSAVAAVPQVREILIAHQRRVIQAAVEPTRGIVVEGRDITTVVAPEAPVRILLTASEQARLGRRALENSGVDDAQSRERERALVSERDAKDSLVTQFLQASPGVYTVDSTLLDVAQTLDLVMRLIDQLIP